MEDVLAELDARLAEAPAGKRIERVDVVALDVFEDRDPAPKLLNVLHVTTRERVIRRELLFDVGDPYRPKRIDESERNLRSRRQLSLVLIVAVEGSAPDRVRVVVITKDVWSLRLNWGVEYGRGALTRFVLQPSEENLFGTHATVAGLFELLPDVYSVGGLFSHARLGGTWLRSLINANLVFNRRTGENEGSFGSLYYGQPLYSLRTAWAYEVTASWRYLISRSFTGDVQRVFDPRPPGQRDGPCGDLCIPLEYRTDELYGSYLLTRSYGRLDKFDLSIGAEAQRRAYRTIDLQDRDPSARAAFIRQEVPVSDNRISPVFQVRAHSTRFTSVLNLTTLGLQEDYRTGHDLYLRVYPAARSFGSTRDLFGTYAAIAYTFPVSDGLFRTVVSNTIEFAGPDRTDAEASAALFLATPSLGFGRFIYSAYLFHQYENYLNERLELGGDTRLRGYAPSAFRGKDLLSSNFELRTRPLSLWSVQVGAAAFYDVGDAFDGFEDLALKQGGGAGIRVLLPQLERTVFRVDWGVPLTPEPAWPGAMFLSFAQAFNVPAPLPPSQAAVIAPVPLY